MALSNERYPTMSYIMGYTHRETFGRPCDVLYADNREYRRGYDAALADDLHITKKAGH